MPRGVSEIAVYNFRTGKGDEDVDRILAKIPASARSRHLKQALRFYADLGGEIRRLNQCVESLLAGGGVVVQQKKQEKNNDIDIDDMLALGIEDLLTRSNGKEGRK